jgi:hypothetical protein
LATRAFPALIIGAEEAEPMKEPLVLIMLALLIVPLLVGVRRIRQLPRRDEQAAAPSPGED